MNRRCGDHEEHTSHTWESEDGMEWCTGHYQDDDWTADTHALTIAELRCELAATRIKLHAARSALAACREVAAKRADPR